MGKPSAESKLNRSGDLSTRNPRKPDGISMPCDGFAALKKATLVHLAGFFVDKFHFRGSERVIQEPALGRTQRASRQKPLDFLHAQPFVPDPLQKQGLASQVRLTSPLLHVHTSPFQKLFP